ncbi:response regulator [Xylophilus sp. ASV27]|uniref:response regulator n=1 Tax=Xylophilus sp. ASV27 TaxID=2795129 RepID=UPI0018EE064C|nr:response regulator [Xylophilus sp. ASV27]
MNSNATVDTESFRRILSRNLWLPLGIGLAGAGLFVGLILYLMYVMSWVEHTDRVIARAHELATLSSDRETSLRGYLLAGDERYLEPYEAARTRIPQRMKELQELVSDNPVQVDRLTRISGLLQEWERYAQRLIEARRATGEGYRQIAGSGQGKRLTDAARGEFTDFLAMEQHLLQERNTSVRATAVLVVVLYLLFSVGFSGGFAYFGRRQLLKLSSIYQRLLGEQAQATETLQQQAWLREGQTRLASQVIGQQSLLLLGRNVLEFMARYLDSAIGAVYVRDAGAGLQRIASYGFSQAQEGVHATLQAGQTLVGQAAQERRVIRLDGLPSHYLRISSGVGEGLPQSAVIVPIESDGKVNGVLELGFLRPLQARDVEFLQLVSPNIGAQLEAERYRQRQQELLAETQQLNEELQVQQEELRITNEELEEQSRVLKESQASLEVQQVELEQSNRRLAEQAAVLDQRNTALDLARTQLEERAEELQRASRYKSEFLANMSHELRTPLNSSLILAKLLADNPAGNLDAEQVRFAQSIHAAGNELLNLINDILDISKVEAGKLDVRPQDVVIARLADTLRRVFEPLAQQKQLALQVQVAPDAPELLHTDRQRLEQVLRNLLSNAIKFTSEGGVSLSVTRQPDGRIAFAVQDSGIGIAPEQQAHIFEAFHQADGTISRRYGGTGLGLSISRDLAHLLGGSLSVASSPGQGSTFTLVMPLHYEAAQSVPPPPAPPRMPPPAPTPAPVTAPRAVVPAPSFPDDRDAREPRGRLVLVVEDEPRFARILYNLAHELGYRCLVAHGADDGLQLAQQHVPDAILLDMGLPDRPGLALLQRLKESPQTRHIPVHVISAEERTEPALHLGAIGYVVKPATREQLQEVFARIEEKLSQKVKHVLVVEDDALQRESIIHLIGDTDVQITAVEFGERALELLRGTAYDCMIIDLKLPDMSGNELLKRMSTEDIRAFPPVIVYTGRNLTRQEEAELLRYSHSIIIKGARSPERLLDEVTLFLHKMESELSTERQRMLRSARSRDKVFEGRKILVVDDDVRNIFALTSALEHKGAVVEVGRNGLEALERLAEVPDIDLVLMDIMMPEMDGLAATRQIRKQPQWQRLPIIAITAKAMKDDQEQCLQAGANDYLAKPIDLDRLFSLMRVWMPQMERTAA